MTTSGFLKTLLPSEGFVCLVDIIKQGDARKVKHHWSESVDFLIADQLPVSNTHDVDHYFGLSSYANPKSRTAGNVQNTRCFWLDIDSKDYASPDQAFEAVQRFIGQSGIAEPTFIVDSGGGYHVYWALDTSASPDVWRSIAEVLRTFVESGSSQAEYANRTAAGSIGTDGDGAGEHPNEQHAAPNVSETVRDVGAESSTDIDGDGDGDAEQPLRNKLIADHSRTCDIASILRLPGSSNYKYDPPREVRIIYEGPVHTLEDFVASIYNGDTPTADAGGASPSDVFGLFQRDSIPVHSRTDLDPLSARLLDDKKFSAQKILEKSVEGTGCDLIKEAFLYQDTLPEPVWQALLMTFTFCEDGLAAAHAISYEHSNYNEKETNEKFRIAVQNKEAKDIGPRTCTWFNKVQPGKCLKCPNYGAIKTPLSLGSYVENITATTPVPATISTAIDATNSGALVTPAGAGQPDVFHPSLVKLPAGYKFGASGAIYREVKTQVKGENGVKEISQDVLVSPYPIYLVGHVSAGEQGFLNLTVCARIPNSGTRIFNLPNASLAATDKLRDAVSENHLVVEDERLRHIKSYLQQSAKLLQELARAGEVFERFGWHSLDGEGQPMSFVLGDRVYRPDGRMTHAEIGAGATQLKLKLRPTGKREFWNQARMLYERPEMLQLQCVIALNMAAPLFYLTGIESIWLNVFSSKSGLGKTALLRFCSSLWGAPAITDGIMMAKDDTRAAKLHRMGLLSHISLTLDEVTGMPKEEVSDFSYVMFNGRPRNRMSSSANVERTNVSRWNAPMTTTSNSSMLGLLRALKAMPDGEFARMMEFMMPSVIKTANWTQTSAILDRIDKNYGFFAAEFLPFIVQHQEAIRNKCYAKIDELSASGAFKPSERYWLKAAAVSVVAAELASELGLMDISPDVVLHGYTGERGIITHMRRQREDARIPAATLLAMFINDHIKETLVFGDSGTVPGLVPRPEVKPYGSRLAIRVEESTNSMYIDTNIYRAYLTNLQVDLNEHINELAEVNLAVSHAHIALGEGGQIFAPRSPALKISTTDMQSIRATYIDPALAQLPPTE